MSTTINTQSSSEPLVLDDASKNEISEELDIAGSEVGELVENVMDAYPEFTTVAEAKEFILNNQDEALGL